METENQKQPRLNDDQTEEEKGPFALHDAVAEWRAEKALAAPPYSRKESKTMKYTYHIECPFLDGWNAFIKGCSRGYCDGYMDAMRGQAPRLHLRLVRSDGKIVDEVKAQDDVNIGMVAGWPTAEQYEAAAERALDRARRIHANQKQP